MSAATLEVRDVAENRTTVVPIDPNAPLTVQDILNASGTSLATNMVMVDGIPAGSIDEVVAPDARVFLAGKVDNG